MRGRCPRRFYIGRNNVRNRTKIVRNTIRSRGSVCARSRVDWNRISWQNRDRSRIRGEMRDRFRGRIYESCTRQLAGFKL